MTRSINANTKSRGRPKTTGPGFTVGVRLQPDLLAALDAWISEQRGVIAPDPLSRPEAIRRLVADALIGMGLYSNASRPRPQ